MPIAAGSVVRVTGLTSRQELNGKEGHAIRYDDKHGRWHVKIEGKGLALKATNLESVPSSAACDSATSKECQSSTDHGLPVGEIVSVRTTGNRRTALVHGVSSDGRIVLRAEPPSQETWSADPSAVTALATAAEEAIPTEYLFCPVLARNRALPPPQKFEPAAVIEVRSNHLGALRMKVRYDASGAESWQRPQDLKPAPEPTGESNSRSVQGSKRPQRKAEPTAEAKAQARAKRVKSSSSADSAAETPRDAAPSRAQRTGATGKRKVVVSDGDESDGDESNDGGKGAAKGAGGSRSKRAAATSDAASAAKSGKAEPRKSSRWSQKMLEAEPTDAWEVALDALQPRADADADGDADGDAGGGDGGGGGGAVSGAAGSSIGAAAASVAAGAAAVEAATGISAVPARDPRLQGFRIGGQAETAEERGEGWCGPWSTAKALIDQRAAARQARIEELGGQPPPPLVSWTPKRDVNKLRLANITEVPSLQSLVIRLLVEHIDAVEAFGVLSPAQLHELAAALCKVRKLDADKLKLFVPEDVVLTELVVPDCHLIDEESLLSALEPHTAPTSPLGLLSLGFCGRCFTPKAAALVERCERLHTLNLTGCYRLSDAALCSLVDARGDALRALQLSGNSQLSGKAMAAVAQHCPNLTQLRLEDLAHMRPPDLLPLRGLRNLEHLSLDGICLVSDELLSEILTGSGRSLQRLVLSNCSLLTDASIVSACRLCPSLVELDLYGVELITDVSVLAIAECLPSLRTLSLRRCVQVSDVAVEALALACKNSLESLSLNNVPAISDVALKALRDHCAPSLKHLDVSWCRALTDHALGSLVDAAVDAGAGLSTLTIWGCAQLTALFFNGHSNDKLRIIGRSYA